MDGDILVAHWKTLEEKARRMAEAIWASPCVPEQIAGVRVDGVIKLRENHYVVIEVSKNYSLDKTRTDIAKINSVRNALFAKGIYVEAYFLTDGQPPASSKATAEASSIKILSLDEFGAKFLGSSEYQFLRKKKAFGSAVSPRSGDPDTGRYAEIRYLDGDEKKYSVTDISNALKNRSQVVLVGEFGSGKSRCIKEIFEMLAKEDSVFTPIAINLRDNWGLKSKSIIFRNHLEDLGLGKFADSLIRSSGDGNHPILLDGFDEIGSQSWSGEAARLSEIRKQSLVGVRDVVQSSSRAGILITGREHYFGSDKEMIDSLGLRDDAIVLRCPAEFTEQEAKDYLQLNSSLSILPDWMPRKPLICQLLSQLDDEQLAKLEEKNSGEVQFFESIVDAVCEREIRIHSSLDADTVKRILLKLAQDSRYQHRNNESISVAQLNEAFFSVTGYSPVDDSSVLLQRLPYLGRLSSESTDRVFIDDYAKNGLRGLAVVQSQLNRDPHVPKSNWKQPLDIFGLRVWSENLEPGQQALNYAKECESSGNSQFVADYVAARLLGEEETCDFDGLMVNNSHIVDLRMAGKTITKLIIQSTVIEKITHEECEVSDVWINDCLITDFYGVSENRKLPDYFRDDCSVQVFNHTLNTSKISELDLNDAQKTLLVIIKKLFFQHGAGRKEEALLRGAESYWDRRIAQRIITFMISEKIVSRIKGDQGHVYVPQRRHTRRMGAIVELRRSSKDPIWDMVSSA